MNREAYSFAYIVGNWEAGLPLQHRTVLKDIRNLRDKGMGLSARDRTLGVMIYLMDYADTLAADALENSYPADLIVEMQSEIDYLRADRDQAVEKIDLLKGEIESLRRAAVQPEVVATVGHVVSQQPAQRPTGKSKPAHAPAGRDSRMVGAKRK